MTFVVLVFMAIMELISPCQLGAALTQMKGDISKSPIAYIPIANRFYYGFRTKSKTLIVNAIAFAILVLDAIILAIKFPNNVNYTTGLILVIVLITLAVTWIRLSWKVTNYGRLPYEAGFKYVIMSICFPYGIAYAYTFNQKKIARERKRKEVLGL